MIPPTVQVQRYMKTKVGGYVDKANAKPAGLRYDLGESGELAPAIKEKLAKIDMHRAISEYPDSSYTKLVAAIRKKYNLQRENITLGTGSNEILERIARTYLDPSDRCLIIHPTFFRIEDAAVRYTPNIIDVYLKAEDNYQLTESVLSELEQINDVKLIWLCTPNNPTGAVIPLGYIRRIAKAHPNTLICVDEAYGEYINQSAAGLLNDCKNILIIKTLSKALGLAGLVAGYALGDASLIAPLNAMRLEFPINGIAAELACVALEEESYTEDLANDIANEREWVQSELTKIDGVSIIPSQTNILLARHKDIPIRSALLNAGILVTDMNNLKGVEGKQYARITIQRQREKNVLLINTLRGLVAQTGRASD